MLQEKYIHKDWKQNKDIWTLHGQASKMVYLAFAD